MISVILPTYNEKGNVVRLSKAIFEVCRMHRIDCEIIVVDDNSPDGTAAFFKNHFKNNRRAHCIVRKKVRGLATAIRTGIEHARGDKIVLMDVDFSHDPNTLPVMDRELNKYDIVLGSRYVGQASLKSKIHRQITTWMMETFIQLVLWMGIRDVTNGYIAIRKDCLKKLNYARIFYGYGDYAIRLIFCAKKKGASVLEIPSTYTYRTYGQTKTRILKTGIQYGMSVLRLRFGFK